MTLKKTFHHEEHEDHEGRIFFAAFVLFVVSLGFSG